ncbi:MAG: hypothetical protein K6A30_07430 [Lachnospiraceae bacterium]|nr:hypothetical protein [Lachnospiraceae bacterium]
MKSKVLRLYDYKKMDLSNYQVDFHVDQGRIDAESNHLILRYPSWKEGVEVNLGDTVTLKTQSKNEKFNKESLKISVGSFLYSRKLEEAIVGMRVGESKSVTVDEEKVTVTIVSVTNKILPKMTDAFVKEFGPENVETVEQYKEYLKNKQKEEILEEISYRAERAVIRELFSNSEIVVAKEDFDYCMKLQMDRHNVLAELEGYNLKEMTKEDFEGKIPVSSYWELIVLLQDNCWEYLESYLIGCYMAETEGIVVDLSEETYNQQIKDYVKHWRTDEAFARKINTFEEFKILQYQAYFYETLRSFYKNKLIKEN